MSAPVHPNYSSFPILIADDDLDDVEMIKDAFEELRIVNKLQFVHDGEELMDYLRLCGKFEGKDRKEFPLPRLILLDLNMPKKDGREVLEDLKKDEKLRQIPVIMLTTSRAEEDILRSYRSGVNSFITKPVGFEGLMKIIRDLGHYWLELVELPETTTHGFSRQ